MTEREIQLQAFLAESGWSTARRLPLAGDASTRRYERLQGPNGRAVLMDAPPSAETPACPPHASLAERKKLGYNAVARLSGPDSSPFVALSGLLNKLELSAPKVLAADLDNGFLLLEDFGEDLFARIIKNGADEAKLYRAAVEVLASLHQKKISSSLPVSGRGDYVLKAYDEAALAIEVELLIDWFWPLAKGNNAPPETRQSYFDAWSEVWPLLEDDDSVLVLRDYHAENLIWLAERTGLARVGLIDFQDAVLGSRAYDLVSLLEDARRDVSPELANDMIRHYCTLSIATTPSFDENVFRRAYAALGAQRNAKIIGIFARLCQRDGKPAYLDLLPRVWHNFEHDLNAGSFDELKQWFDRHLPSYLRRPVLQEAGSANA